MSTSYASSPEDAGQPGHGPWSYCATRSGPPFPVKAAIVIGGLAVFPPLGLAALAYFALRHKFGPGGWGQGGPWMARDGGDESGRCCGHRRGHHRGHGHWQRSADSEAPVTGNTAFEARRREVLEQIEKERKKLREEAQAFRDFAAKERQARDQAEFNRFMADKDKPADGDNT